MSGPNRDKRRVIDPLANKPRHFGVEFTSAARSMISDEIREVTGDGYSFMLMHDAMLEFGKKYGVPFCYTYIDDAYVYLCNELGIDYRKYPHNVPKLPIDDFLILARQKFRDLQIARNEMQRKVQRGKLRKAFIEWVNQSDGDTDDYIAPDFDKIADQIAKANAKRPKVPQLRLVHSA